MTVLRDISTTYASMFSLVLFMTLFESRRPKKETTLLTLGLMGPLMAVNVALLFILGPTTMSTLLLLTCSLPSLIFFWLLARHRDGRFFFTFCLADTLMLEVIYTTAVLDFFLGNTYIFTVISRLILCPLVAYAVYRWVRPFYLELQNHVDKGWYVFASISLIFYMLLTLSSSVPTRITQRPEQLPAFILLLILVPVVYLHILITLRRMQLLYEAREKESILNVQVESLCSRVDEFTTANERFREERHDFRHKMRTMAALAESGQLDEVKAMASEYSEAPQESVVESYCGHAILDAVLSSYLQWARRKGIRATTKLDFPDTLQVSETELATVFANAIENAIHACEKLEPEKRFIEIKAITQPAFMLQIRNSFDGVIAFDKDGVPLSGRKGHGFGTRSIVTFCEKNNAFCEFGAEGETFFLRMMFH